MKDIADAGALHAEVRGVTFAVQPVNPEWAVTADAQLLESAVTNLLNNALRYTRAGGQVVLRVRMQDRRVLIEVEDECGGLTPTVGDPFQPFGQRRGQDRTGLGLGLSIARKAVRAHGGDIHIRNIPGTGCVSPSTCRWRLTMCRIQRRSERKRRLITTAGGTQPSIGSEGLTLAAGPLL